MLFSEINKMIKNQLHLQGLSNFKHAMHRGHKFHTNLSEVKQLKFHHVFGFFPPDYTVSRSDAAYLQLTWACSDHCRGRGKGEKETSFQVIIYWDMGGTFHSFVYYWLWSPLSYTIHVQTTTYSVINCRRMLDGQLFN